MTFPLSIWIVELQAVILFIPTYCMQLLDKLKLKIYQFEWEYLYRYDKKICVDKLNPLRRKLIKLHIVFVATCWPIYKNHKINWKERKTIVWYFSTPGFIVLVPVAKACLCSTIWFFIKLPSSCLLLNCQFYKSLHAHILPVCSAPCLYV